MYNDDNNNVGERFYAPTFGFPPQRMSNMYDANLVQHESLNGPDISRVPAPQKRFKTHCDILGSTGEALSTRKLRWYNQIFG